MDESEKNLSNSCWNKYKEIHKDKVLYLKQIYIKFQDLKEYLQDFKDNYNGLNLYEMISQIVGDPLNDLVKDFDKSIKIYFDTNMRFIDFFLKEFSDINNNLTKENNSYDKVVLSHKKYKEKKDKSEKIKNNFINKLGNIEENLKEKILKNDKKITVDMKKLHSAMKDLNEYKKNMEDLDKLREVFNNDQKIFLEDNIKELIKNENIFFDKMREKFHGVQQNISGITSSFIQKYDKQNMEKENKNTNYFTKFITKFSSNEKPEEKIKLFDYYLRYKPYEIKSNENIVQANQINEEILKHLKKAIKDNYPDCGLKIQEATYNVNKYYELFFTYQVTMDKQLKEAMLKVLEEDNYAYHSILIELAKMRADSKFFESRENMEFVTELLIEILKLIEQKHDLKSVKDCILLSQTYYILDENNKKIYSFEKLKKYKWLRTVKFWREFLDYYINRAFDKFEFDYGLDVKVKDNPPKLKPKTKDKVKDVLFSCLVPYINNMNEIQIDKRVILKLLDEITNKYKYLDEASVQNLEVFISNSSEEIAKLRKEYKDNPDLENELEKKIMEEKDEFAEKEDKEEEEEKEEIDKIEEKKEIKEEIKENEIKEEIKKNEIKEEKEEKKEIKQKDVKEEKKEIKEVKEEINEVKEEIKEKEVKEEIKEKEVKEEIKEVKEDIKEKDVKEEIKEKDIKEEIDKKEEKEEKEVIKAEEVKKEIEDKEERKEIKEEIDKIIENEKKGENVDTKEEKEDIKEKKEIKGDIEEKIEEKGENGEKKEIKEEIDNIKEREEKEEKEEIVETKEKEVKENVEIKVEIKEKEIKEEIDKNEEKEIIDKKEEKNDNINNIINENNEKNRNEIIINEENKKDE